MKKIYLIRHGQSKSQTGEADKEDMNPLLRGIVFDRIIVSTMQRAIQTFTYSQPKGRTINFDSRLIEGDWAIPDYYKSLVGLKVNPIKDVAPDTHNAYLVSFETRVVSLMKDVLAYPEEKILLFGHFGIFGSILRGFLGLPADGILGISHMENTAISILEIQDDGKKILSVWNERAHVVHPVRGYE